jgi:catechol 2,3-dioxygenase-like lactoylglutathione lyase family enzyme
MMRLDHGTATALCHPATVAGRAALGVLAVVPSLVHAANIPELMLQPSVNLVLSVADVAKSKEFYGEILRLKPLPNLNLPGGLVMTRYQVGTTEIKLLHSAATRKAETGDLNEATGVRRLTLYLPDQSALSGRFQEHGRASPRFEVETGARGWPRALVADPDGNQIELIVPAAGTPDAALRQIELRLTVNDLQKSRKFYREFIGFEQREPIEVAAAEGGTLYPFRHGNTTLLLASFGDSLPAHTGRWEEAHGIRYIQYIVRDLDAVSDFAKSAGVKIEQPIFPLGKLARILFIADPDGIINEFVGLPK